MVEAQAFTAHSQKPSPSPEGLDRRNRVNLTLKSGGANLFDVHGCV
jgi:hypothetical protein